MRKLSLIIGTLILLTSLRLVNTNPHGKDFNAGCADCHTTESWKVNPDSIRFNHDTTAMPLLGQHKQTDCRLCHITLVFEDAETECKSCHTDIHEQTVGPDCARCHTSDSWIVQNITQIHLQTRFPLLGAHINAHCSDCHPSESLLRFEPLGIECIDCHRSEYTSTTNPNHQQAGYSTDCAECHFINSYSWKEFIGHDAQFFPIYSGQHNGVWNDCSDCHTNPSDYGQFSCTDCHQHNQGDMDDEHSGVSGYSYNSIACLGCHPTGSGAGSFNHNNTGFPLTGAHTNTECKECHGTGNAAISSLCKDCHQAEYNEATNPDHTSNAFPNTCEQCHTTEPGWKPATFPNHNEFYALNGAHATIANNCASCHTDNYNNTPNTCVGCHQSDYNQTNNPPHESAQFSTECLTCHTENAWTPSTFGHDVQYFPIYSGKHNGVWNTCAECHTNPAEYARFSCIDCHEHNQQDTDGEHNGIGGYVYSSEACFACHPTGDASAGFDHNSTAFPLTGAHTVASCLSCHGNGYAGTSMVCSDCHTPDYNQTSNPNHISAGIPNTCASCHSTEPGWQPATFPIHNEVYPLNGAHASISNNCISCHNGNYTTTPNTCVGCHLDNYNQTNNPPHASAQFPTDCQACHTETAWLPSTFNHDAQYFPIYSGNHNGQWSTCSECHTNSSNFAQFSCIDCHEHNQADTDPDHQGVNGYDYNSQACFACHPTGDGTGGFDHSSTAFPLTGSHTSVGCSSCHTNGYTGTTTVCSDCHVSAYNQTTNPDHTAIGIPNTCNTCHSTEPGWQPAGFPIHENYYPLTGGHAVVANDCAGCHNGNYNTTPNSCSGCHSGNYNETTNPDHTALNLSTECAECHTTNQGWNPALFPVHNSYYPLTGGHAVVANDCAGCHNGNYNTTPEDCSGCHLDNYNQTTNPNHQSLGLSADCAGCHTTNPGWNPALFPVHNNYYVLEGAHISIANNCSACHNGNYNSTPNTCTGCHIDEYNQTNNPPHASAQFPTDCEQCHTQSAWIPSTFDHDAQYFPIYSGQHNGEWNTCADCHTNPGNYAIFSCIDCHEHNQTDMDNDHQGVSGYAYNSNACLSCHPDGVSKKSVIRQQFRQN